MFLLIGGGGGERKKGKWRKGEEREGRRGKGRKARNQARQKEYYTHTCPHVGLVMPILLYSITVSYSPSPNNIMLGRQTIITTIIITTIPHIVQY